jgi:hypothetical protein
VSGEGAVFSVTQNLEIALWHLRRTDELRVLWIDAVCINQADIAERSNEAARMDDIFSRARQVVFWLGPKSEDSDLAMARLQSIGDDMIRDKTWDAVYVISGDETEKFYLDHAALWAKEAD